MPIRGHHFRAPFVLHRQRDARVQRVPGGEPVSSVKVGQRHFCAELPHGSVPRDHPVSRRSFRSVVPPEDESSNRRALPWNQSVIREAGRCGGDLKDDAPSGGRFRLGSVPFWVHQSPKQGLFGKPRPRKQVDLIKGRIGRHLRRLVQIACKTQVEPLRVARKPDLRNLLPERLPIGARLYG